MYFQCNRQNVVFSPNRKGDNRILTPREENSIPRGEAARDRIFTSRGVRILLSPARLGEITILMTLLIAYWRFHVIFHLPGENGILSRFLSAIWRKLREIDTERERIQFFPGS